jgi:hypothetical protein
MRSFDDLIFITQSEQLTVSFFYRFSAERKFTSASHALLEYAQSAHNEGVHDAPYGIDVRWPSQARTRHLVCLLQCIGMSLSSGTFLDDHQSGHGERVHDVLYSVNVQWTTPASDFAYLIHTLGISLSSSPSLAFTQPVLRTMRTMELWDLQAFLNNSSALFRDPQALALELSRLMELVVGQTGAGRSKHIYHSC